MNLSGAALVVASAAAFGAMAILARIAYASGVDTATLLALRFSLAALVMVAIARARAVPMPHGNLLIACAMLGALGYGGQAFSFFTALTLAPAGSSHCCCISIPQRSRFSPRGSCTID